MEDKLKELTNKIYSEGVSKAENDAKEILNNAQKEADSIIKNAKEKAEKITNAAKSEAEELKRNTESEIKLSSRQAINALKQDITELITTKLSENEVNSALKDNELIKDIITKLIDAFAKKSGNEEPDIDLILPEQQKKELEEYFNNKQKDLLSKGMELKYSDKFNAGFVITQKDNTYKLNFTEETFEEFFKYYLRPRSKKLLYG